LSKIGIYFQAITEVERDGPINLFKREPRKGLRDTLGGLPAEKGADNRVKRNTTSGDPIAAISLLSIQLDHFFSSFQLTAEQLFYRLA
jgi:hypothetical protein